MRDQQCGHTGCPEQITQMRQGMGSLEAAGCPPCTHTSHTHNWLSTDFFSLWTYTGAQEGGIIEWKKPEKLPITHHPGGPEGMHKPHHQSWWQGEKWSHLLRAVLLQRMFSVPYGEFFCILPINYYLLVFPKILLKTSPPCMPLWLVEADHLETSLPICIASRIWSHLKFPYETLLPNPVSEDVPLWDWHLITCNLGV